MAVIWIVRAPIEYRSEATLEFKYTRDATGAIVEDLTALSLDAFRKSEELMSAESQERLQRQLEEAVFASSVSLNGAFTGGYRIDVEPPRLRKGKATGPAFLKVYAYSASPSDAGFLVGQAADLYVQQLNEDYDEAFRALQAHRIRRAEETASQLRVTLAAKRSAVADETGPGTIAVTELVDENSRLLSELLTILGQIRSEAAGLNVGLGRDTLRLDRAIVDLTQDVQAVGDAWERGLKIPLQVLYSIESLPEYQLSLLREEVLHAEYRDLTEKFAQSNSEIAPSSYVTIVSRTSHPELVRALGISKRNLLVGGAGAGMFIGWFLGNLGDQILASRRRRDQGAPQS